MAELPDTPQAALPADTAPPAGEPTLEAPPRPSSRPVHKEPDHIGQYRILEKIGEGGMGIVYKAEQREPVRRVVALKVIKLGMDTKEVVARFEAERQALAMLSHPNVAKVLDAGMTENGRPYFAMEFVAGVPLTQYCEESKLTTKQRLELFIPICQAVQHAHQKGIIHRDLKPANVLVTLVDGKPAPKVIDFGIAKATNQALTQHTLFTQTGALMGTPEYMSPEQAQTSGLDVDTRTDIYSLGVILYELLTGSLPIDPKSLREAGLDGMARLIKTYEPQKPSTRLTTLTSEAKSNPTPGPTRNTRHLQRELRGDLDWIVLKAMEKDRSRRYETANALSMDIQRHLDNEPVLARPPSTTYRMQKFVSKHRFGVLAGSGVLMALLVGLTLAIVGFVRAKADRDFADKARIEAQAQKKIADNQRQLAVDNAKKADDNAKKAESERDAKDKALIRAEGLRLTAQSTTELQTDPSLGLLLAIEAAQIAPSKEANEALFAALDTCREERTLFPPGAVLSARFTPDGKRIMGCTQNGMVFFWDAETGKQLLATPGFGPSGPGLMADALLSPDGKYFVTIYAGTGGFGQRDGKRVEYTDRVARLWDAATGKQVAVLRGHKGRIRIAAFSADNKRLVTASSDATVRIWDIPGGRQLAVLEGHACIPSSACFSCDGKQVLTISSWHTSMNSPPVISGPPPAGSDPEEIQLPDQNQGFYMQGGEGDSVGPVWQEETLARVWDAETGKQVATIPRPKGFLGQQTELPASGHFSPDGKRVALGFGDDAQIWDVVDRKMLFKLKQDATGTVTGAGQLPLGYDRTAWSPDGQRFATIRGNYVSIWDAIAGKELMELRGHESALQTLSFSPSGKLVLTTSQDRTARAWNAETGEQVAMWRGHKNRVRTADLSPDGQRVVTAGDDGTVRVWWLNPPTDQARPLAEPIVNLSAMALSPNGRYIATGTYSNPRIWDTASGKLLHKLEAPREGILASFPDRTRFVNVSGVVFSPDSRLLLSIADEEQIKIRKSDSSPLWTLPFLTRKKPPPDDPDTRSKHDEALPFTPGRIWDVETGKQLAALQAGEFSLSYACFSPDGRKVLTADSTNRRTAVYSSTGQMIESSSGGFQGANLQTFVRVYDTATGKELLKLRHEGEILRAEFSADGRRVLVSIRSNTYPNKNIKMWDAENGTLLFAIGNTWYDTLACFSPDRKRMVGFGLGIRFHDATSGKELVRIEGSAVLSPYWPRRLMGLGMGLSPFSPDGKTLLAHGKDGLGLLDVQTGKQLVAFRGHGGGVNSALFSMDGRFVVTASDDQTARVWDTTTGEELHLLRHKGAVQFAVMHPDGRHATTASDSVRIWDLEPLPIAIKRKPRELSSYERERFGLKNPDTQPQRKGEAEAVAVVEPPKTEVQRLQEQADREIAESRTQEALIHLAKASAGDPKDTLLSLKVAALQAWFGQDAELAITLRRVMEFANGTTDPATAERAAKIGSLRPSTDKSQLDAALALARRSVELGKDNGSLSWFQMALGMVEYRSGNYQVADEVLSVAAQNAKDSFSIGFVPGTSAFYRAMSLFRQGKEPQARTLFTEAASKMNPLPADEKNPLAGDATHDDLILWMAYKEAKILLKIDAVPAERPKE